MSPQHQGSRLPYHGSCHCGHIRYLIYITLPPAPADVSLHAAPAKKGEKSARTRTRFYKCNCSACLKMGILHMRPAFPDEDFFVVAPESMNDDIWVGDYRCVTGYVHWYFCKNCGVRCFQIGGAEWVREKVGLPDGEEKEVLRVKPVDGMYFYVSVNALTVDQDQRSGVNLDLRELVDSKGLIYLDCKEEKGERRVDYPHVGGTW